MEDSLRMNVLLNQDIHALRIDESKMVVYGLSAKGEATVPLNPNCRDEQYVKKVKEVISSHVLGSPGGYPIYLRRWTRMGQAKDDSLERLLQLGEPEAVVAVVHANGITNEIARRAWWAMPNSHNARCLLRHESVVNGDMGRVLAEFLLEFLPFEEEPNDIINSVKLVLQGDLITEEERLSLWKRGQRKNAFLVGFLYTLPDTLYEVASAHPLYTKVAGMTAESDSAVALLLTKVLSEPGQAFLKTVLNVMKKPANQDVVIALMDTLRRYFSPIQKELLPETDDLDEVKSRCEQALAGYKGLHDILPLDEEQLKDFVYAMLYLSQLCERTTNPIFSRTDAIGTVMRKKLDPVFAPVIEQINVLYAAG